MTDPQENQPRAVTGIILLDTRSDAERDLDYIITLLVRGQVTSRAELRKYLAHHSEEFGMIYEHANADLSQRIKMQYFSNAHLSGNAMQSISPEIRDALFLRSP